LKKKVEVTLKKKNRVKENGDLIQIKLVIKSKKSERDENVDDEI